MFILPTRAMRPFVPAEIDGIPVTFGVGVPRPLAEEIDNCDASGDDSDCDCTGLARYRADLPPPTEAQLDAYVFEGTFPT